MTKSVEYATGESGTLMRSFGLRFTQPKLFPPSSPFWHQFVVAKDAPVSLIAESKAWLIPPGGGFWVPAGVGCSLRNRYVTTISMLYLPVDSSRTAGFDLGRCAVVRVSTFLRELVWKIVVIGALQERDARHRRLAAVVWDELAQLEASSFAVALPSTFEAKLLIEDLEQSSFRLDALGPALDRRACSRRTLERAFLRETQSSLGEWLRKRRLLLGLERLLNGEPVSNIAFELGYNGPSAFIAMVKRETGRSPGELRRSDAIELIERRVSRPAANAAGQSGLKPAVRMRPAEAGRAPIGAAPPLEPRPALRRAAGASY